MLYFGFFFQSNKTFVAVAVLQEIRYSGKMLLKLMNFLIVCGAFVLFLYGVRNLYIKVDRNNCRMTYMFESPQFSVITISKRF